jgi:hypothetical protein
VIKNLSPEVAALTQTLAEQFGTKVQITATGNKDNQRGKIIFEYFSEEELKGLIKKLQED